MSDLYSKFLETVPKDRIEKAREEGTISLFEEAIDNFSEPFRAYDIGIIGAGDFAIALAKSLKKNVKILIYDSYKLKSIFSQVTRISTNRGFLTRIDENIDFTLDLKRVLDLEFIIIAVPANIIPHILDIIKATIPNTFKEKQYILVSKGFIRRGYIPHRWLQKNGVPFEKIIWASGGNVAKEILEGKSLNIAVVSINKNKTARKKFANFFDKKYLVPNEYSGSALLACELGGILKNYYAGLGRYLWIKYGDKVLDKYKIAVRKEFRRAVRSVSGSPIVSVRGWVIRKASHGPAFWEDLDVTIRDGRNGLFGEAVLSGASVAETLEDLGLVESFNTIFSTISLFNRLRGKVLNRLPILKSILEIYENLYLQHIDSGDAKIDDEVKSLIEEVEKKILS